MSSPLFPSKVLGSRHFKSLYTDPILRFAVNPTLLAKSLGSIPFLAIIRGFSYLNTIKVRCSKCYILYTSHGGFSYIVIRFEKGLV